MMRTTDTDADGARTGKSVITSFADLVECRGLGHWSVRVDAVQ